MKELFAIIQAFEKILAKGQSCALATVVHVDGSSYRRPGARMLVAEDGQLTGAISGGCLEGDAMRKALYAITQKKSMVVTYDTNDEDDAKLGVGLGCNGIIQVLIEPIDASDPNNPMALLKNIIKDRKPVVIVTLFSLDNKREAQLGTCLLTKGQEIISILHEQDPMQQCVLADVKKSLNLKKSLYRHYIFTDQSLHAFIEYISPVPSLVAIGAGNDVIPLIEIANLLGWQTTVVDGRPNYAKSENFAGGCRIIVAKPESLLDRIVIDDQTVFVLMTHNYNFDLGILKVLLKKEVTYIGSLGPRKKLDRMLNELMEEGMAISDEVVERIYGPSGLDIGAETPEEIALSIIAEIKAVLANRGGGELRQKEEVIHPRAETIFEVVRLNSIG